ncbi:MAG: SpoIIE family protein phosphatase [Gemmatimonadota bacterium]|nr:SpoIIE family protein phosphatase [Gemmatimonadota bacterium]
MSGVSAKILVVDDTPSNIQSLAATLKPAGYQVLVATNGQQALDVMAKVRPDLILLDIMMPVMDGFEACAAIKANAEWRDIPIIFLTAKTETADLVKGFELGAVDYVNKPFNAHELMARVHTHLTVDRLRTSVSEKNAALEKAQAQMSAELDLARAMQVAILPSRFPVAPGCDGSARMLPATTMGGDFYDFIELPGGRIGLVMADVSGKGVPAAFFMAVARTNLNALAATASGPADCLQRTNDVLLTQNPMDLFVTVFYAVFDPATGSIAYANGGHNPPLIRRANGTVEMLTAAAGLVLGMFPATYEQDTAQLAPGDTLVLYTDGVTEAFNVDVQMYEEARLVERVRADGGGGAKTLVASIFDSVIGFSGAAPQSDDITVAVLSWAGAA